MIYKYFKECKKLIVLITLLGMLIGMLFFITKDTPPTLVLKKKKINIEYGQTYYANFKGLVDTTGMSKKEICYLKKNVSITDNLQNEDQKSYPAVGKYKIFIKYNNKLSTIQIICKDTLAPVLAFPKNVDVIKESDLESIDFKSLIIATDLSPLKEIQIDTSQIDIHRIGEYQVKVFVEDIYKNRREKEFKVNVIENKQETTNSQNNQEKNVDVIKESDLESIDFKSLIIATDLSPLKEIQIDTSQIDIHRIGEYQVKVFVEDIYKNRREKEFKVNVIENKQETTNSQNNQENNVNKIESENNKPNEDITISQSNEKNNVKDHLDNDHQQTKPPQTVYWYECYLCGLYVDSNVSLEDAKKKFDQTKCTDAIEFSGIEWRHSRFHYGINHS